VRVSMVSVEGTGTVSGGAAGCIASSAAPCKSRVLFQGSMRFISRF
jgi:hypothetical protein